MILSVEKTDKFRRTMNWCNADALDMLDTIEDLRKRLAIAEMDAQRVRMIADGTWPGMQAVREGKAE